MPVVIAAQDYSTWLQASPDMAAHLCRPYPEAFQAHLIGRGINNPSANGAALLDELSEEQWQASVQNPQTSASPQQRLF